MAEPIINIYGKLKNVNVGGYVVDTTEIIDNNFQETQEEINKKLNKKAEDAQNIVVLKRSEYIAMEKHSPLTLYQIVDTKGEIQRIYIGDKLIFSEDVVANQGFPYTFPILL